MAAVAIQIRGTLYDLTARTTQQVVIQGDASLLGLGIGGGPIIPPEGGNGGGGSPPGIWGPTDPRPTPPIANVPGAPGYNPPGGGSPPGIWGPPGPWPTPPIYFPPQVPPDFQPPEPPPAGTVTPVPPPEGSGGWPVAPIVPPAYLVVQYPGVGPVYVTPPTSPSPQR